MTVKFHSCMPQRCHQRARSRSNRLTTALTYMASRPCVPSQRISPRSHCGSSRRSRPLVEGGTNTERWLNFPLARLTTSLHHVGDKKACVQDCVIWRPRHAWTTSVATLCTCMGCCSRRPAAFVTRQRSVHENVDGVKSGVGQEQWETKNGCLSEHCPWQLWGSSMENRGRVP